MPQPFVLPRQVILADGSVASGAVVSFFRTLTNTPQNVFTDAALSAATVAVTADSAGMLPKVYLDPNAALDYRISLETAAGSLIYQEDGISPVPQLSQAQIGQALYPQIQAEIDAGVTPQNFAYPYAHILRYIPTAQHAAILDGSSGYDASQDAQAWLDALVPQTHAVIVGIVRAQGLVLRVDDIEFSGGGWLKPVSNAVTSVITFGEDSTNTLVRGIRGLLRVGVNNSNFTLWNNVTGVRLERMTESVFGLDVRAMGVGILGAPGENAVSYNHIYLGKILDNKVAIRIAPTGAGFFNENTFYGGNFSQSSGIYESGCMHIDIQHTGSNIPNNNRFIAPSLQGAPQVIRCDGIENTIEHARFEAGATGTAGTNFAAVFFEYLANATQNRISFGYNQAWLSGTHTIDHGAATRVDDCRFDLVGIDHRTHFFEGAWVSVTISGTTYFVPVRSSTLNGSNTRVTVASALITGDLTATITARMTSIGLANNLQTPAMNVPAVSVARSESRSRLLLQMMRSALYVSALNQDNAALTLAAGNSSANIMWQTQALTGAITAWCDANGQLNCAEFGLGDAAPVARQAAITAPTGGATIDAESRAAINSLITRLEAFGFVTPN